MASPPSRFTARAALDGAIGLCCTARAAFIGAIAPAFIARTGPGAPRAVDTPARTPALGASAARSASKAAPDPIRLAAAVDQNRAHGGSALG